jgi:hypothetical protein
MKRTIRMLLAVLLVALATTYVVAEPPPSSAPKPVQIGLPLARSNLPPLLAQERFLPAQSISAVDISGDGRRIAVATMAFRHDRNFWELSDEGKVLGGRYLLPWAPYQVAASRKGEAYAVGLAYSRITPPYPTLTILRGENDEIISSDDSSARAWLRYGTGNWRTGWLVSALGDQVVRAGDSVYTPTNDGAYQVTDDTTRKLRPFPQRPYRLAASDDGKTVAFAYIRPEISRLEKGTLPESFRVQAPAALVSMRRAADWQEVASVKPVKDFPALAPLPDPVKDFPELAEKFNLRADALLPFWVAAAVAVNADGSRCAFTEYRLAVDPRPAGHRSLGPALSRDPVPATATRLAAHRQRQRRGHRARPTA